MARNNYARPRSIRNPSIAVDGQRCKEGCRHVTRVLSPHLICRSSARRSAAATLAIAFSLTGESTRPPRGTAILKSRIRRFVAL